EKEVLTRFAEGKRIKQIAEEDGITVNTANYYLRMAYKKLNVHSREELAELLESIGITPNMNS
ncbi:MAG: response regulator transcription factor, partial [Clostridia bacterium]|nr:response regulator transcription factor [Clostridia bacterium]